MGSEVGSWMDLNHRPPPYQGVGELARAAISGLVTWRSGLL
jgi:hypothetical protein